MIIFTDSMTKGCNIYGTRTGRYTAKQNWFKSEEQLRAAEKTVLRLHKEPLYTPGKEYVKIEYNFSDTEMYRDFINNSMALGLIPHKVNLGVSQMTKEGLWVLIRRFWKLDGVVLGYQSEKNLWFGGWGHRIPVENYVFVDDKIKPENLDRAAEIFEGAPTGTIKLIPNAELERIKYLP